MDYDSDCSGVCSADCVAVCGAEPPTQETRTFAYTDEIKVVAVRSPLRTEIFANAGGEVCDEIVFRECWAENVYRLEPHMLRRDAVVVDIGANIGAFTLLSLAMPGDATVIAVEPDTANADILAANVELNGWADRCIIDPRAVGADPGTVRMVSGGGAAHTVADVDGDVTVCTLADLCDDEGVDEIDFLKVDCEGGEYGIIAGARRDGVLERVRWIGMEFHTTDDATWGQMIADLVTTHSISGIIGSPATGGML